ncbi:MAG TPA: 2OG-Fe(II) oxygenase [Pyrinomonadaceae bacterium]|nr:2OG-Fe(II) oxygenase [Pyrinomonadaceae bacterium]
MSIHTSELVERFRLFLIEGFLEAQTCEQLIAETRLAWGGPATVYRPGAPSPVDESLRKTTRFMLSAETTEFVRQRLLEQREKVESHFQLTLSDCESPQFLFYKEGDFFVPHQDGNTEQLQFDHLRVRRVSVVIFLNRQSTQPTPDTYCGGSLAFYEANADPRRKELGFHLNGEPGLLVAFPAETTHEVTPVAHGERYSIVCWYR